MIAATYNCGCPMKLSSLISEPLGSQAPCSPCCFQSRTPHHSQIQTAQRCTQSRIIKKPKHISEDKACCCINHAFRTYSTPSRRPVSAAVISASKKSVNKQFPRSSSESKLENFEQSNMEQAPTDKVVSEIVKKEQPYKEIEAIINDNRVIIRMHKEPVRKEYDPPCECIGQVASKESALSQRTCDDGVVFDMAQGNLELYRAPREPKSTKKTCEEMGCREVTLYPNIKEDARGGLAPYRIDGREVRRSKIRSIDLEENPNIFLLRVRKHCDSGDKRQKIDLEFRTPRPWLSRKKEDDEIEEHEDTDKKDDTHKEYEE